MNSKLVTLPTAPQGERIRIMIAVTFHKDGTHEIVRSENGISFLTENLVNFNVVRVYFAKSEADAKTAIQALKTTA